MRKQVHHNTMCFACGRKLSRTKLGYDLKTMKTYCMDVKRCGVPHDTSNLVPCAGYDEFMEYVKEAYPKELFDAFKKMIGKAISFRTNPAVINHILKVSQSRGCSSLNQTITVILEEHMRQNPLDDMELQYCDWDLERKYTFRTAVESSSAEVEEEESPSVETLKEHFKKLQEQEPDPVPLSENEKEQLESEETTTWEEFKKEVEEPKPLKLSGKMVEVPLEEEDEEDEEVW